MNKVNVPVDFNSILNSLTNNTIPQGCSQRDEEVLANIQNLIRIIDAGIDQLENVVSTPSNGEESIEDCKSRARTYLNKLGEYFQEEGLTNAYKGNDDDLIVVENLSEDKEV